MKQYKIYRQDNYIIFINNTDKETFYGFVKEVRVDKSNANKASYTIYNIKGFSNKASLLIEQLLKEDESQYTESEFETFYTQNTGNFNSGGIPDAPENGVQYARQDGEWTEVTSSSGVESTGSDNYLAKFSNSGSVIENSAIYDDSSSSSLQISKGIEIDSQFEGDSGLLFTKLRNPVAGDYAVLQSSILPLAIVGVKNTQGDIYVQSNNNGNILKFSPSYIQTLYPPESDYNGYGDLALDDFNNIYSIQRKFDVSLKINKIDFDLGTQSTIGTYSDTAFTRGMVIDSTNTYAVVTSDTSNLLKINLSTGVLSTYLNIGGGSLGLVKDADDNIYAIQSTGTTISIYKITPDLELTLIQLETGIIVYNSFFIDNNILYYSYTASVGGYTVVQLTLDGTRTVISNTLGISANIKKNNKGDLFSYSGNTKTFYVRKNNTEDFTVYKTTDPDLSIVYFLDNDGSLILFPAMKIGKITAPPEYFLTLDSLGKVILNTEYISLEVIQGLIDTTISNSSTPSIHIIPTGDFVIPDGTKTRMITLTDTNDQIVTLPAIPDSISSIYFITNESSGLISNVSVVSKTGTNDLFDGGTYVNNKILTYGMSLRFFNDGRNFKIIG